MCMIPFCEVLAPCSQSNFGEFPLSFAAAVGDEKLCNLLLNQYSKRLDRMFALCELQKHGATKQSAGKIFAEEEMGLITGLFSGFMPFVAASGGQLFTEQQVVDFSREMDEWITAPTREGGAGFEFDKSHDDTIADTEVEGRKLGAVMFAGSWSVIRSCKCEITLESEHHKGINKYKQVLIAAFINRQTSRGNTALHQAVIHERIPIIDWLLAHKASMLILNADHLTAFTIAARRGAVPTMSHLINYQKLIEWKYGSVALTQIDLEQIDTFRIQPEVEARGLKWLNIGEKPKHGRKLNHPKLAKALTNKTEFTLQEWKGFGIKGLGVTDFVKAGDLYFQPAVEEPKTQNPVQRLSLKCDTNNCDTRTWNQDERADVWFDAGGSLTRRGAMEKYFNRLAEVAQGRFVHRRLHQNPNYLSALEVVVMHEKLEFITGREDLDHLDSSAMYMAGGDQAKTGDYEVSTQRNVTQFERKSYAIRGPDVLHLICYASAGFLP
jgi:ankyrin repeat protein